MVKSRRDIIKKILIYVFLFCYIYSPQWIGGQFHIAFSSYYWGWFCFLLFLPIILANKEVRSFFKNPLYSRYILIILLAAMYYLFRYLLATNDFNFTKTRVLQNCYPIISLINLTVIVFFMKKIGYTKDEGIRVILNLAAIQGVVCALMLMIPSFKNVANILFINSSSFKEGDYILSSRIYGIASDYTYAFPISHGLLCGLSLFVGFNGQKRYIVFSIFILLSVLLNGRTGFLIAIITLLLACVISIKNKRNALTVLVFMLFILLVAVLLVFQLKEIFPNVYTFAFGLFRQISERSGTIKYLFETNFYLPEGLGFIFGEGHMVFGGEAIQYGYMATDIGFVNDMFMGGIIYVFLRYFAVGIIIFGKTKQRKNADIAIIFMAFIMWVLATIKGQSTANAMIIAILQLLFITRIILPDKNVERRCEYDYQLQRRATCFRSYERI